MLYAGQVGPQISEIYLSSSHHIPRATHGSLLTKAYLKGLGVVGHAFNSCLRSRVQEQPNLHIQVPAQPEFLLKAFIKKKENKPGSVV